MLEYIQRTTVQPLVSDLRFSVAEHMVSYKRVSPRIHVDLHMHLWYMYLCLPTADNDQTDLRIYTFLSETSLHIIEKI